MDPISTSWLSGKDYYNLTFIGFISITIPYTYIYSTYIIYILLKLLIPLMLWDALSTDDFILFYFIFPSLLFFFFSFYFEGW